MFMKLQGGKLLSLEKPQRPPVPENRGLGQLTFFKSTVCRLYVRIRTPWQMRQGPCHQGSYSCVNKSLDPRQCPQQFFPILITNTLNGKHQLFPESTLCPKPDLALNSQNMLTTPKEEGLRMSREQMTSLWKSHQILRVEGSWSRTATKDRPGNLCSPLSLRDCLNHQE